MIDIILALTIVVALLLAILAVVALIRERKKKKEETLYQQKGTGSDVRWQHRLYVFLSTFALSKSFVEKIRVRYEILEPGDIRKTEDDTIKTVACIWGISLVVFVVGFLIDFSPYSICASCFLAYAVSSMVLLSGNKKKEVRLMEQLNNYLNDVEHEFYATNMIETAVSNSLIHAEEPIYSHMYKISEMLDSSDYESESREYIYNTNNQFLRLFLSACELVNKFDDRKVRGYSNFVTNLSNIKTEIGIWLRTQALMKSSFKGTELMILAPMLFVPMVNKYMPGVYEDVAHYYTGAFGIIMSVVILLVSMLLYGMVSRMKDLEYRDTSEHGVLQRISNIPIVKKTLDGYEDNNYGKVLKTNRLLHQMGMNMNFRFLQIERFLSMIGMFVVSVFVGFSIVHAGRVSALEFGGTLNASLGYIVYDDDKVEELTSYAEGLADSYIKSSEVCNLDDVTNRVTEDQVSDDESVVSILAESVVGAVEDYRDCYFKWWYLLICGGVAFIGYHIPFIMIESRKDLLEITQENEVIQFQGIISMVMHIEEMTPDVILKWMYRFSNIFQSSLETCISRYSDGDEKALEKMKEDEPFLPFQRIVDNLIDSDVVGIEKAFSELDGDRTAAQKRREQDHQMYINGKAAAASLLAFVPTLLLLAYVAVPTLLASFNGMSALGTGMM